MIKHLALCGGGIKGIVHLGVIKTLIDNKLLDLAMIESVAGTSIGAFIGFLFVMKFSFSSIKTLIMNQTMSDFLSMDYGKLVVRYGLCDPSKLVEYIDKIIALKIKKSKPTMADLYAFSRIDFIVSTTNIDTGCNELINHVSDPTLQVSQAIMMSMAIPILFEPITYKTYHYIDGGITNNYPINAFADKLKDAIGINIACGCVGSLPVSQVTSASATSTSTQTSSQPQSVPVPYPYFENYLGILLNVILSDHQHLNKAYTNKTIKIDEIDTTKISMLTFDIPQHYKQELYEIGINCCYKYIKKNA
ncbi:Patatin phospholipase [uncultured virus]|nr:Patatin phospholipase [uncultured virus]